MGGTPDHTNTRAESFHVLSQGEFADMAGGDFRLVSGSSFIEAGEVIPYWDEAGVDFAVTAPDLGPVQTQGTPAPDTTPPTVLATSPAAGATSVAINVSPTVTFSEPMDPATITTSTVRTKVAGSPVAGVTSYDAPSNTATHNPTVNYANSTVVTIEVTTGAEDVAGNAIASTYTSTFTTIASPDPTAPTVASVSPADGATGVGVDEVVVLAFSEALDAATVNDTNVTLLSGPNPVAATVGYTPGGVVVTVTPSAPLAYAAAYTVGVATGVEDVAGNALAPPFAATFTTGANPDPGNAATTHHRGKRLGAGLRRGALAFGVRG
jgi:hypothetical protein